ncbi:GTPase [Burkholderia diffusa]|uniref:GTPase n=1 Tax=Burkholderia diffusa TaxID=488732 RepID=UPI001584081A|nr:GTPase [Burkholderia diffusa]
MSIHDDAQKIQEKLNQERDTIVSVALFGQPGAGKSSLINMIIGKDVAEVGVETDKTVNEASYEANGLRFVDLPGYGTSKFPKETYFDRFDVHKFDLFLCVTSGKLHHADTEFFNELARREKVCIFVVNKEDELWERNVTIEELKKRKVDDISAHVGRPVKVMFTSCRTEAGLDALNTEIKNNLEGAKRERWLRGAKAYSDDFLREKKEACGNYVTVAAAASALNAINPIPGADVAVDLSILFKLFSEIRDAYGLSEAALDKLKESAIPIVGRLANNVLQYAAREGILLLMKNMLGRQTVKELTKYVPFIGQAIAATAGYGIAWSVGNKYLEDCHDLAQQILTNKLAI